MCWNWSSSRVLLSGGFASATRESGLPSSLHPQAPIFLPNSFRPPGHSWLMGLLVF
jgi:hypothetical protein